jgi:hypothetical protein
VTSHFLAIRVRPASRHITREAGRSLARRAPVRRYGGAAPAAPAGGAVEDERAVPCGLALRGATAGLRVGHVWDSGGAGGRAAAVAGQRARRGAGREQPRRYGRGERKPGRDGGADSYTVAVAQPPRRSVPMAAVAVAVSAAAEAVAMLASAQILKHRPEARCSPSTAALPVSGSDAAVRRRVPRSASGRPSCPSTAAAQ